MLQRLESAARARRPKLRLKPSIKPPNAVLGPESSETYHHVIARLNAKWRVIACTAGIQWILQRTYQGQSGPGWASQCYCRTREGLVQCARERAGEIGGDALVILLCLPERIEGKPGQRSA
jgi:hypothetical protein